LIIEHKYSHSSEELLIGAARNKTTTRKKGEQGVWVSWRFKEE